MRFLVLIVVAVVGIPAVLHALKTPHSVPKVVGLSRDEAHQAVKDAGLSYTDEGGSLFFGSTDQVCSQDPRPTTKTKDSVHLFLGSSCGPPAKVTQADRQATQDTLNSYHVCKEAAGGFVNYTSMTDSEKRDLADQLGVSNCP